LRYYRAAILISPRGANLCLCLHDAPFPRQAPFGGLVIARRLPPHAKKTTLLQNIGANPFKNMVLPVRIELTTSALPRMRSTTELRQQSPRLCGGSGARLWRMAVDASSKERLLQPDGKSGQRSGKTAGRGVARQSAQAQGSSAKIADRPGERSNPAAQGLSQALIPCCLSRS
jgi:hypothetical protein